MTTQKIVDLDLAMLVRQRQYSPAVETHCQSYPYRWKQIDKVVIEPIDLTSKEALINKLETLAQDYIEGEYSLTGFSLLKRNKHRARNGARHRRDFVPFVKFKILQGYVQLITHKKTKLGLRKHPAIRIIEQNGKQSDTNFDEDY